MINDELKKNGLPELSNYSFRSILFDEKIRITKTNKYFFYIKKTNTPLYSDALIALIVEKSKSIENYVEKCVNNYKRFKIDKKNST